MYKYVYTLGILFGSVCLIKYFKKSYQLKYEDLKELLFQQYEQGQIERTSKILEERETRISKLDDAILEKSNQISDLQETFNLKAEKISETLRDYENELKKAATSRVEAYQEEQRRALEEGLSNYKVQIDLQKESFLTSLNQVKDQLTDLQQKQMAANEELLRRKEISEQADFYRPCISPESLSDIKILNEVKQKLKKTELIDRIIYDNYISKPVLEMLKRVLNNISFSGIYKITCIPTQEVYIGKSTDIKSRWQQHCKTAFNCGTIASSLLHTKMKQYGIENFTFEVLERVPKDKLTEREKYWIDFYQTKEVGLNEKKG